MTRNLESSSIRSDFGGWENKSLTHDTARSLLDSDRILNGNRLSLMAWSDAKWCLKWCELSVMRPCRSFAAVLHDWRNWSLQSCCDAFLLHKTFRKIYLAVLWALISVYEEPTEGMRTHCTTAVFFFHTTTRFQQDPISPNGRNHFWHFAFFLQNSPLVIPVFPTRCMQGPFYYVDVVNSPHSKVNFEVELAPRSTSSCVKFLEGLFVPPPSSYLNSVCIARKECKFEIWGWFKPDLKF